MKLRTNREDRAILIRALNTHIGRCLLDFPQEIPHAIEMVCKLREIQGLPEAEPIEYLWHCIAMAEGE
jgi:hypothetical protein